ncbi:DUF4421 family protein [Aurantibacillus circumpalustris]|uniref:DUF4421 family protein n=1 Tax=Aurantibacillus circumpalustris TaxID=3036359 RepID=UPI00295AC36C|nr:DUF4421 family protein [Aurantibacillus circumpalustris]
MWIHRSAAFIFMKEQEPFNDTSYYSRYKERLVVTLPLSTRYVNFEFKDKSSSSVLKYSPNNLYDLGISVNTKLMSFFLNTGATLLDNDQGIKGKTNYKDFQFNVYGKKSTIDFSLQTYNGFYINNSTSFNSYDASQKPYEIRPDISVVSLGFNYYYVSNYRKFSYRGSFAFTECQKKSAGSLLTGGYFSIFSMTADSNLVSKSFTPYFDPLTNIKTGSVLNYGLNVGYIYTFVIRRKFHATISLVQGLGVDLTSGTKEDDSKVESKSNLSSKQNLRIALGYDRGNFFYGIMGMFDFYYFDNKERATFNYSYGKFRLFAGYRFNMTGKKKKVFRKLNLIDYRL